MKPQASWKWTLVGAALVAVVALLVASGGDARLRLLTNTIGLALATVAAALPMSAALAIALTRFQVVGRSIVTALLVAFLFVPLYIQAAAWEAGFGRQGWWSLVSGSLAAPPLVGWTGAIFVHAVAAIPWATLIIAAGLRYLPSDWEEAASLEGTPFAVLSRVTLPLAAGPILAAALWVFVAVSGEITVADLYQVGTYPREIYSNFALSSDPLAASLTGEAEGGVGAAPGVAIVVCAALAAFLAVRLLAPAIGAGVDRRPWQVGSPVGRLLASVFVWTAAALLVAVPLASLMVNAGLTTRLEGVTPVRHWSPAKFATILSDAPNRYQEEAAWTLLIAATAATAAVALAAPLAWLACRRRSAAAAAMVVTVLMLAAPGPLIGLAIIWLLNRPQPQLFPWLYDRTILAPVLATFVRALPLTILILWHMLRTVPQEIEEAAALDGLGPGRRLAQIVLGQRKAGVAVAWLVAFAVAQGDLAASILVLPPGLDTLSRRIFGLIHFGVSDQVAGISLTIFFLSFAAGLAVVCLARRRW